MAISRTARITILLVIDVLFFLVEIIVGYAVGSLALVADSFHMLNDILSLIVALYAIRLTTRQHIAGSDTKYSYGWHRAEILAALVNGVFLLALCFSIFMEAIERFFNTPDVKNPKLVVIVGSLGLASNFLGLFLFHEHDHSHAQDHGKQEPASIENVGDGEHAQETTDGSATLAGEDTPRGRSIERPDSLYGHPAATRMYVVQEAQELQQARSQSLSARGRTMSSSSYSAKPFTKSSDTKSGATASERTPLLADEVGSVDDSDRDDSSPDRNSMNTVTNGSSKHKRKHTKAGSMNMRALVLHVMGDALGNVGVIATGLVIWLSTLSWRFYFDPIISLVITCIIFSSALPLVKSASFILLQGVPNDISLQEVDEAIRQVDGVYDVHELHIWQLSESKVIASVHVHASRKHDFMKIGTEIRQLLHDRGIHSTTIQPEYYHSKHPQTSNNMPADAPSEVNRSCLITCPRGEAGCSESACCPPPPPPTV